MSKTRTSENVEFLRANRAALRQRWGMDPCSHLSVERPSGVEHPTDDRATSAAGALRVQLPGGQWLDVHDEAQPLEQARAWLARALAETSTVPSSICVIGAGAGWIVDAIVERCADARILVFEPEPAFVEVMLARRDYGPLIEAGRLMIVAGPSFDDGASAWRLYGRTTAEPALLIHEVIAVARREAAVAAARLARQAIANARGNETARRRFAAPYLLNTLRHLPVIARENNAAALFGVGSGRPVVVAGAGPSLNRNLEALRPLRDRVVLLSADTALRPCLAAGLAPDFVVAVDPGAPNARHLTGLPPCDTTALVAEPSLAGDVFDTFQGRTFLFRVAAHHPWPWVQAHGLDVATLRAWGSVMITAFDLAIRLEGDPVIFIGSDLAYSDGQPYCRGTVYEEDWARWMEEGQSLDAIWRGAMAMHPTVTEAHAGESIVTAPHLVQFRDAILDMCRSAPCAVFNATGAGILRGPGIVQATIDVALRAATRSALPPLPRLLQSSAAVDRLRAALQGDRLRGPSAGLASAWATVLAEHDPPDGRLADELDHALAQAAAWARSEAVAALP